MCVQYPDEHGSNAAIKQGDVQGEIIATEHQKSRIRRFKHALSGTDKGWLAGVVL
jgi:hypothetical protein